MNRLFRCLTILFLIPYAVNAAPLLVDYYGAVSSSSDTNMIKMAQDLFYSQLKSIDSVTVSDRRNGTLESNASSLSIDSTPSGHIAFYAEISEQTDNSGAAWNCTLHAIDPATGKNVSESAVYDSYYKILISAKSAIESVLSKLSGSSSSARQEQASLQSGSISTESLAGTWSGESDTDKIVILRGGRGFVIFKNGASMTISIRIENEQNGQSVEIRQAGKPNASFYPSLPRETALAAASSAEPIVWNLKLTSEGILTGTKTTLVASSDNPSAAITGTEPVTWRKK